MKCSHKKFDIIRFKINLIAQCIECKKTFSICRSQSGKEYKESDELFFIFDLYKKVIAGKICPSSFKGFNIHIGYKHKFDRDNVISFFYKLKRLL